jgi:ketosteroid isomerase-like protein
VTPGARVMSTSTRRWRASARRDQCFLSLVRLLRMRNRLLILLMLMLAASVGGAAQVSPDETMIRDARARSNAAIAKHDLAGIAAVWMDDVHVTSSTSARGDGRAANQERMGQQFARRPDTIYLRSPLTIDVYAPWSVASERGAWTGRWTEPDGVAEISGTYLVQWRKIDGRWLIQSELYVPTACKGSTYCAHRP